MSEPERCPRCGSDYPWLLERPRSRYRRTHHRTHQWHDSKPREGRVGKDGPSETAPNASVVGDVHTPPKGRPSETATEMSEAEEVMHEHLEVGGLPEERFPEAHAAIRTLARERYEAGQERAWIGEQARHVLGAEYQRGYEAGLERAACEALERGWWDIGISENIAGRIRALKGRG